MTFTGKHLMGEKKKALELKKHVGAIHAGNRLTLLQRKISNALLYNAYEDLLTKEDHQIHIAALCKIIGYVSNDYKTIKKTLVNLISTVIQWNLVDGDKLLDEGVWNASAIISSASIDGPICTYSYSNSMRQLLYHPEFYGRINIQIQARFQSTYGLALYENCIRYQNIEQTPWFEIDKFRKLMGIEDGKYKVFRDLKTRVIDKAVEEVNKYSPINISPLLRKQGRQVSAIQFKISKSILPKAVDHSLDNESLEMTLKEKMGLSKKQIKDVLLGYDHEYIKQKISLIESSTSFALGKIGNLAKYLLSALKDDYQPTKKSNKVTFLDKYENENKKRAKLDQVEIERKRNNKKIIEQFKLLPQSTKSTFLKQFEKFIDKGVYVGIYNRDGIENILIQDQLCKFIDNLSQSDREQYFSCVSAIA